MSIRRLVYIAAVLMLAPALVACHGQAFDELEREVEALERQLDASATATPMPATPTPAPTATSTAALIAMSTPGASATVTGEPTPSIGGAPTITVQDGQGAVGDTAALDVMLTGVSNGVSGFVITVSMEDPTVARIVGAEVADIGLKMASELPASEVRLQAADLQNKMEGVIDSERLGTVEVEMLASGETRLLLVVERLDDDDGSSVASATTASAGTLTVSP